MWSCPGDLCGDIAVIYGLTLTEFLALNHSVWSDCNQNLWLGNAYCLARDTVSNTSTTTTNMGTTSSNPTITASDADSTPTFNPTYSTRYSTTS